MREAVRLLSFTKLPGQIPGHLITLMLPDMKVVTFEISSELFRYTISAAAHVHVCVIFPQPGTLICVASRRAFGSCLTLAARLACVQKAWEANGWKPPPKVLPPNNTYRKITDRDEFLEKRAAEEAEADKVRKRKGQSASFSMLYGTKVSEGSIGGPARV